MDAEDEAEDVSFFDFTSDFSDSETEEDIIATLERVKKARSSLPVEQLADLYLQALDQNRVKVVEALCDVLTKRFKSHRSKYVQAGIHQIVAGSLESLSSETWLLKKALLLLSKFKECEIKFEVDNNALLEGINKAASRDFSLCDDIEITKHILSLVISEKADTSPFEKAFCKMAKVVSESNDLREKIEKEFLDAVSLDQHITLELFGKLIQLLSDPSFQVPSKIHLLEALHKILNRNNDFVYPTEDETLDALIDTAKDLFKNLYNSPCPTSSDANHFNLLISLIAKLECSTPEFLDVAQRSTEPLGEECGSFNEIDLFPELHVNVNGSADYTSDYKKCKCSSKCSCESVCFCGCTECQRPPLIGKAELYRELVHTNEEYIDKAQDGAAEHAYVQLKSPLLKIFDDEEQFERILKSIKGDSEVRPDWEKVEDGKKLSFSADFESGNLQSAKRIGEYDYELVLHPDTGTAGNSQWFYFSVTGMIPKETYNFKLINMEKSRTLFK